MKSYNQPTRQPRFQLKNALKYLKGLCQMPEIHAGAQRNVALLQLDFQNASRKARHMWKITCFTSWTESQILSKPRNSSIDRQKILWMQIRVMSDYICEEVVVQILLTLSSKSLIDFKLVCRLCYSPILKYTLFSIKNADRSKLILRHYDTPNHKGRFTLHYNGQLFSPFKGLFCDNWSALRLIVFAWTYYRWHK